MLVLTRKINERIVINNNIEICVVEITDGRVRLGIKAPRDIPIAREEVAHFFTPQLATAQT